MTTMEGALVEPAAVGMHAAVLGGAQPGKSIVILGGGTIGLMVLQACISLGATDITVVDVIEKRLELAKKLGAARVINGKEEDTVAVLDRKKCTEIMAWISYLRRRELYLRHSRQYRS